MGNANDEMITRLEHEWPRWQVWVVHRAYGGPVWCARRWDGEGGTLNAHTPAELAEYLGEAEAPR